MRSLEILKTEHDDILIMLDVLEKISEKIASCENIPTDHLKQVLNFLEIFADKCHNGKEENYLFAEIKEAEIPEGADLLRVLISEHSRGRRFIDEMKDLLKAHGKGESSAVMVFTTPALQYIDLYRSHIWKENTVLFTMAEETLPAGKLGLLEKRFEILESEIGGSTVKTLHETLDKLSKIYLRQ